MPTPKSVCYISDNTYSASFDGAKDAAYTAKYGHPPEIKQGREKGRGGKGKEKGRGGRGRRAALRQGVERGGKEGEGRDRKKEGEGGDGGPLCNKGWKGEGGRKGKEEWGTNPYC